MSPESISAQLLAPFWHGPYSILERPFISFWRGFLAPFWHSPSSILERTLLHFGVALTPFWAALTLIWHDISQAY